MTGDEWEIARLCDADKLWLKSHDSMVYLSQMTLDEHLIKHPEISREDYQNVQKILDSAEVWHKPNQPERLIYVTRIDAKYFTVVKRTKNGSRNYLLTLFKNSKLWIPDGALRLR
ncbi:MAG: hypothetical protein QM537_03685 [Candidatus Symbiobacter sp.]|nr:hypothetical protein [Candidatus Symbiobacter sp.]